MRFYTTKELDTIIGKLGTLQVALAKANDKVISDSNNTKALACYSDLSRGIMDIVQTIDGDRALQVYAAHVLPYYMGGELEM